MSKPTISILMGIYNEEAYITESIESILDQTYNDFEFIIVDDASTDHSTEIVHSYNDPRIELLVNESNQGLTYSLNRALDYASGKYIARQDADDISEPERLEKQAHFLEQYTDVAVVGTGAYLIDNDGHITARRRPKCNPTFEDFLEKGHLIHGSIMARKSVLESVDGYDEFFRYAQDQELWLRLAKDYPIANLPEPLYRHRLHDGGVYFSRKDESAMYGIVASDLVTRKIDRTKLDELSEDGILSYYEELSTNEKAAFHRDLATRYLRYGHISPAQNECDNALGHEPYSIKTYLLKALATIGPVGVETTKWCMRKYLNTKIYLHNRLSCPYNL